ncbi:PREDICTED: C-C motif chemokine 13-like [Gekko japonicus]|uniref:C-C motif chemokine 13-like n=1 Tax=Gekko japonicus TaxID=146911 RepID=A0ABM1JT42_GEKJA|nr:PREDICTED: C-C motif chemokine 13-like [Gekko japonicus]
MARMNFSVAALALFLVAGLLLQSQAQPNAQHSPHCPTFTGKPVPLRLLKSYEVLSRHNPPAVLFYTKKNRQICADPKQQWTQDRMDKLSENGHQENP